MCPRREKLPVCAFRPCLCFLQDSLATVDEGDESEYDDDDVAGAACGLRAAGDGKFDIGLVFRMMDRDKDGVVSIRDWGVATGSGPGLGARMTGKQVCGPSPPRGGPLDTGAYMHCARDGRDVYMW